MRVVVFEWLTKNAGGFLVLKDTESPNLLGHFVHSKEQFCDLARAGDKIFHPRELARGPSVENKVTRTAWPETSPLAPMEIYDPTQISVTMKLSEEVLRVPTGMQIIPPNQWWTCFNYTGATGGMIGWMYEGEGRIAYFYSKEEELRICKMQCSLDPASKQKWLENIQRSPLPMTGGKPTTELTGLIPTLLCAIHAQRNNPQDFLLTPKTPRGNA